VTGQPFVYVWDVYPNTTPVSPFYLNTIRTSDDGPDAGTVPGADTYVSQQDNATNNFGTQQRDHPSMARERPNGVD
jgi:hypothetical protein